MKLKEYFEETGIPITVFARRCKLTSGTIYNILKGKDIRLSVALKIEEMTKGQVQPKDLMLPQEENLKARKKSCIKRAG